MPIEQQKPRAAHVASPFPLDLSAFLANPFSEEDTAKHDIPPWMWRGMHWRIGISTWQPNRTVSS
ncbi:hypothetical protein [Dictyobacter kobayashii]|uniref:Uncharacterized protein n=1 Tax=Dictyobacter kobayashii TaxID=2014872 RepID=A0A402APQ1_9CHLR|nr:hypothetical protein [Dictyobacter kobayashii]GCE20960.1 hypothetical protein KDK_47600 [Dictyobacter kobayashii]